ncbi:alanine racemase [Glutamicibacter sp. PS]|uniref:alanine racemase n=1 Tax=Glutamicibacter sp. PS TaxID=3075634 RepID=UPI0037C19058
MNFEVADESSAGQPPVLGHQDGFERRAEIDLSAIRHNVRRIAELVAPAAVLAVVKADGYGHGAEQVARAALSAGARWLGTAHVTEALALRQRGLTAPMLAWLHTADTPFDEALANDIDLGVSGWELDAIAQAAQRTQTPARVHLKVDTGLGRNGIPVELLPEILRRAEEYQDAGLLRVVGVFSHLAVADEPEREETDRQLECFDDVIAQVEAAGFDLEVRHIANTPGILSRPDSHHDLVRLGLGMYGLSPFADESPEHYGLRPAMRLVTKVANVKRVPAGQGVSYGLRYVTERPTVLGLIPVGYGDGLPRVATGAPVSINGRSYPVRGTIAMDQCVVDLGPDADPQKLLGAEAVIFGSGGQPVTTWAEAAGTINYEMITRISPRVPRHYVEGSWGATDGN